MALSHLGESVYLWALIEIFDGVSLAVELGLAIGEVVLILVLATREPHHVCLLGRLLRVLCRIDKDRHIAALLFIRALAVQRARALFSRMRC